MRRDQVPVRCRGCSTEFTVKRSKAATARFCARECKDAAQRFLPKNDPRSCVVCGTVFTPERHSGHAKYCSKPCIWKATKGSEFNARIARETAAKRGDALRGTGEGKSYRKFMGRHEHRVVAERKIGRPIRPGEHVHHIDHNILNNHPDNLEVLPAAEHMRLHGIGIPGQRPKYMEDR